MDGIALVRERRVLTLGQLAERIAGEPISGSWWGHPAGKEIYRVATALEEARDEVLVAKLVDGKVTFVHRALWPALARVVLDEGWRKKAARGLTSDAAAVLRGVEASGRVDLTQVPMGSPKTIAAVKKQLEAGGLVISSSEHTDQGSHATVLTSWKRWVPADIAAAARALSFDAAADELRAAGLTIV